MSSSSEEIITESWDEDSCDEDSDLVIINNIRNAIDLDVAMMCSCISLNLIDSTKIMRQLMEYCGIEDDPNKERTIKRTLIVASEGLSLAVDQFNNSCEWLEGYIG